MSYLRIVRHDFGKFIASWTWRRGRFVGGDLIGGVDRQINRFFYRRGLFFMGVGDRDGRGLCAVFDCVGCIWGEGEDGGFGAFGEGVG